MTTFRNQLHRRHRLGFTLIELVVVLLIVAALAGLVIPQVAMLGRTTDMAVSAKTQADLASNIQLFFVLQKRYPQGLDSLITDGTSDLWGPFDAAGAPTTVEPDQAGGLPVNGGGGVELRTALAGVTLANDASGQWNRSFTRSGFDYVYDHQDPNDYVGLSLEGRSASNATVAAPRTLANGTPSAVAEVTGANLIARVAPNDPDITNGTARLIALGIGPKNSAISKTLTNSPTYPGADGAYYARYVAIFKIYATGERATLVSVVDCYGRHSDYATQQFNESLPNGGRQG